MHQSITKVLLKRLISSLIVVFILLSFIFFLVRIAPGSPADRYISPGISPALAEKIRNSFNLNNSLPEQYWSFLKNAMSGNFGYSYTYHLPVMNVIGAFLPFSVGFALITFAVQVCSGFACAAVAYKSRSRFTDSALTKINYVLYSIPSFVTGVFLIYVFSYVLGLLPSSGIRSVEMADNGFIALIGDYLAHLILPVVCLALTGIPVYYKYFRDSIEETYNKLFVMSLRSSGVGEKKIFLSHVIPNSITPVLAYAGIDLGMLFGTVVITETIFGLPGMGRLAVQAILCKDYPLVIGCSLVSALLMVASNIIADMISVLIDKRLIKGVLN